MAGNPDRWAEPGYARPMSLDPDCPVHGPAAAENHAGERGHIDTEVDIVDKPSEAELRSKQKKRPPKGGQG